MLRPELPVIALSVFLLAGCREEPESSSSSPAASSGSPRVQRTLTRVDAASQVCMVNDRFMGSDQIPVTVAGKTYYGCCAGCKNKLQNQASARTAVDPVTRRTVDKASAVIARTETGQVMYFESLESLARFQL